MSVNDHVIVKACRALSMLMTMKGEIEHGKQHKVVNAVKIKASGGVSALLTQMRRCFFNTCLPLREDAHSNHALSICMPGSRRDPLSRYVACRSRNDGVLLESSRAMKNLAKVFVENQVPRPLLLSTYAEKDHTASSSLKLCSWEIESFAQIHPLTVNSPQQVDGWGQDGLLVAHSDSFEVILNLIRSVALHYVLSASKTFRLYPKCFLFICFYCFT